MKECCKDSFGEKTQPRGFRKWLKYLTYTVITVIVLVVFLLQFFGEKTSI